MVRESDVRFGSSTASPLIRSRGSYHLNNGQSTSVAMLGSLVSHPLSKRSN
jgi:hypothetical protein